MTFLLSIGVDLGSTLVLAAKVFFHIEHNMNRVSVVSGGNNVYCTTSSITHLFGCANENCLNEREHERYKYGYFVLVRLIWSEVGTFHFAS